jgi:hypothetical protein
MNGAPGFMQHQNGRVAGKMRQEKVGKHNEWGLIYLASCNQENLLKLWERSGAWVRISAQPQHSEE